MPSSRCGEGREHGRGESWIQSLRQGHWERIYDTTRLYKDQFKDLLEWCEQHGIRSTTRCIAAEKLRIFLYLIGINLSYRQLREAFCHSLKTIHKAFHDVLRIIGINLYREVVHTPENTIPSQISASAARSPFFDDCRGAINGTHIPICVPMKPNAEYINPGAWRD